MKKKNFFEKFICATTILLAMLFVCSSSLLAKTEQNPSGKTISGVVLDVKSEPLIGVTVVIKGTTNATMTDIDGKYFIIANPEDILMFSYTGYQAQERAVGSESAINIVMREASIVLDDVVVVGYGTQKKISVTGAVTNAPVKMLQSVPTASLANALAGQMPGVITRQSSGEPGFDGAQIYIRGLATLHHGDSRFTSPLVLVDGVERDINIVNSQEIETMTVLKDASATAVYGVRGANGVILITTKKGQKGKPQVSFRTEWGQLRGLRFAEYVDSYEYATLMNEAQFMNDGKRRWTDEDLQKFRDGSDPYNYPNVNWTDEVLKRDTWQSTQNVKVSGGDEIVRYYVNVGYTGKDGLFKEDKSLAWKTNGGKFRRYNLRSNIDVNAFKDIVVELGLATTIQDRGYQGKAQNVIRDAVRSTPSLRFPAQNPDGSVAGNARFTNNPWGLATQSGFTQMFVSTNQGNVGLKWDLSKLVTKGLTAGGKFAFDHFYQNEVRREMEYPIKHYDGKDINGDDMYTNIREGKPMNYVIEMSNGRRDIISNYSIYWEAAANYNRTFGVHNIGGMFLYNRREHKFLTAPNPIENIPYRHQGVAGRFSYNFASRYLAEFNFGYNGSEQFPKGDRYGFFPSASIGWVISNESFWNTAVISNFKIRGSVGKVGNDRIASASDRFLYLTALNTNGAGYDFGYNQDYIGGIEEKKFGMDLRWETSTKYNLGLDMGFLNKINLQVDIFKERREGILVPRKSIPMFVGLVPHGVPYGNLGIVDNKGMDASIEFTNTTSYGLGYTFRGNYTFARNKIIEDDSAIPAWGYQNSRGRSLSQALVLVADGFFGSQEEINNSPIKYELGETPKPGYVKYKDMNGDNVINEDDRVFMGHPQIPEIMFGFSAAVTYKWFDASVHFSGVANRTVFINGTGMYPFAYGYGEDNILKEYFNNRWIPGADNSSAKYPVAPREVSTHNNRNSTLYMRDGKYLKLQSAEIGYTLPKSLSYKLRVSNIRFFTNGTNLLTFDKIKIMDPEMNYGDFYPQQRVLNFGAQIDF